MMTKDGLIFEANSLKQGRLQALTRQQLQAQATQNRERRWMAPDREFGATARRLECRQRSYVQKKPGSETSRIVTEKPTGPRFSSGSLPYTAEVGLKAEIKRETIERPKRASGRSFVTVVTRKRPSLNRACGRGSPKFLRPSVLLPIQRYWALAPVVLDELPPGWRLRGRQRPASTTIATIIASRNS